MTDDAHPSRCFSCGGPADQLNEVAEGENCPACAERLLETLQGVFHTPWVTEEQEAPLESSVRVEASGSPEDPHPRPRGTGPVDDGGDRCA